MYNISVSYEIAQNQKGAMNTIYRREINDKESKWLFEITGGEGV